MKNNWLSIILTFISLLFLAHCTEAEKGSDLGPKGDYKTMRERMVETQIKARGVKEPRVLAAMLKVERHLFVPKNLHSTAYIVALMTELLDLKGEEKVLEIGTGSGYQAAILAELAKEVYTIEIIEKLARSAEKLLLELGYKNIKVKAGDGYLGWPEAAPFDAIIVTCAPDHIPKPLVETTNVIPVIFVPMTGEGVKKKE